MNLAINLVRNALSPRRSLYELALAVTSVAQTVLVVWLTAVARNRSDLSVFYLSLAHIVVVSVFFANEMLSCIERRWQRLQGAANYAVYVALIPFGLLWPLFDLWSTAYPSPKLEAKWRGEARRCQNAFNKVFSQVNWSTVSAGFRRILQRVVESRVAEHCVREKVASSTRRAFGWEGAAVTGPQVLLQLFTFDTTHATLCETSLTLFLGSLVLRALLYDRLRTSDTRLWLFFAALTGCDVLSLLFPWLLWLNTNRAGSALFEVHTLVMIWSVGIGVAVVMTGACCKFVMGSKPVVALLDVLWMPVGFAVTSGAMAYTSQDSVTTAAFLGVACLIVLCWGGHREVLEAGSEALRVLLNLCVLRSGLTSCLECTWLLRPNSPVDDLRWDFVRDGFEVCGGEGERRLRTVVRHAMQRIIQTQIPDFEAAGALSARHGPFSGIAYRVECALHAVDANRIHLYDCCMPIDQDVLDRVDWRGQSLLVASLRHARNFFQRPRVTTSQLRDRESDLQWAVRGVASAVVVVIFIPFNTVLPVAYAMTSGWDKLTIVQQACVVGYIACMSLACCTARYAYRYFTFSNAMQQLVNWESGSMPDLVALYCEAYEPTAAESLCAVIPADVLPGHVVETAIAPFLSGDDVLLEPSVADLLGTSVSNVPKDVVQLDVAPFVVEDDLVFAPVSLADCFTLKHKELFAVRR